MLACRSVLPGYGQRASHAVAVGFKPPTFRSMFSDVDPFTSTNPVYLNVINVPINLETTSVL